MYSKVIQTLVTVGSFALVVILTAPSPSNHNQAPTEKPSQSTELSPAQARKVFDMLEELERKDNLALNTPRARLVIKEPQLQWRLNDQTHTYHTL